MRKIIAENVVVRGQPFDSERDVKFCWSENSFSNIHTGARLFLSISLYDVSGQGSDKVTFVLIF